MRSRPTPRRLRLLLALAAPFAASGACADYAADRDGPGGIVLDPLDAAARVDAAPTADAGSDGGGPTADAAPSDAGPARYVDPCDPAAAVCTTPPTTAGKGLTAADRCAFALGESSGLGAPSPVLAALKQITVPVTIAEVLADLNRTGVNTTTVPGSPAGVRYGFRWNPEDQASTRWIPQGITGSIDADPSGRVAGRRVIVTSFYDTDPASKGVRVAIVDATAVTGDPPYRLALLVEPKGTAAAPTFVPVPIHAGGLAWVGRYLYVASTTLGLRVFDMDAILRVAVDNDTVGCTGNTCRAGTYKYAIPQVGTYAVKSSCAPIFSSLSYDRSSSPPSLVSGEYCSASACAGPLAGRVFRWPLDPRTGLLRSAVTYPTEVFHLGQVQVQGVAANLGGVYQSSSAPSGGAGALYRTRVGASATSSWGDTPEDLMIDPAAGLLWSQSELAGARAVYAASLASYPIP